MIIKEFTEQIKQNWRKQFPESKIFIDFLAEAYPNIYIRCYIAKDNAETFNKIMENDMLNIKFFVYKDDDGNSAELTAKTKNNEIDKKIVLEVVGKSYSIKPKNKFFVYGHINLPFRKTRNTPEKIIAKLDKYFAMIKKDLEESLANDLIHENHKELLKSKLMT
jgi:hypothetical protein